MSEKIGLGRRITWGLGASMVKAAKAFNAAGWVTVSPIGTKGVNDFQLEEVRLYSGVFGSVRSLSMVLTFRLQETVQFLGVTFRGVDAGNPLYHLAAGEDQDGG